MIWIESLEPTFERMASIDAAGRGCISQGYPTGLAPEKCRAEVMSQNP